MFPSFKTRCTLPEIIDLGSSYYTEDEYRDCLIKLGQVGRWLGGDRAMLSALRHLKSIPKSALDVGCGGGSFMFRLHRRYPDMHITGIDTSEEAILQCRRELEKQPHTAIQQIQFKHTPQADLPFQEKSFDVVMATLVCHHMSDEEIISFIEKAKRIARQAIVINDLHRHPIPYGLYKIIAPSLFQNRLITHDGLLSIRKGFTRDEWGDLLKKAGCLEREYTISWHFPFRWLVTIQVV